ESTLAQYLIGHLCRGDHHPFRAALVRQRGEDEIPIGVAELAAETSRQTYELTATFVCDPGLEDLTHAFQRNLTFELGNGIEERSADDRLRLGDGLDCGSIRELENEVSA